MAPAVKGHIYKDVYTEKVYIELDTQTVVYQTTIYGISQADVSISSYVGLIIL